MAVLNNRYTITNTQKLPAGSTFIPASQIKSTTTTVQKNTDNYRPISYSSEMKQAAQKLADSGNPVGSYYLWQDNPEATGSAAWMESELKKKGIDLSSKSNTGNGVADFFIEAGKGIIEIPIGLKRTLSAGSLGAVGVSKQSTKQAVKTLSEGTSKAISSTVDSAIDNPGRFTGAVVGGIVLTKGVGKLSAVPKTAKVTTAKTSTGTTKTASLTVGKTTISKSKTKTGGKVLEVTKRNNAGNITAGFKKAKKTVNVKQGNTVFTGKRTETVLQIGNRKVASRTVKGNESKLESKGVTNAINLQTGKTITHKLDTLTTRTAKNKQTVYMKIDRKGNLKTAEKITKSKQEKATAKQYMKSGNRARLGTKTTGKGGNVKEYIRNGETKRRVQKGRKTESERIDLDINIGNTSHQLTGKTGKAKRKYAVKRQNKDAILLGNRMGTKRGVSYRVGNRAGRITKAKANKRTLTTKETARADAKTKTRTIKIKTVDKPLKRKTQREPVRPAGTISGGKTKTTKGTDNTNNHTSGGMMYQTKTKSKTESKGSHGSKGTGGMMYQTRTKTAGTGGYQSANILRGQQATKTAQKVRGTAVTTKQAASTKTGTKPSQTTVTRTQAKTNGSTSTTAKTSGNSVRKGTGNKDKQDSKRAAAVVTTHRLTTAQSQKPAQKKKQNEILKRAQAVRKKQKKLLRLSDEETKKRLRKSRTRKSKGYLRSEKRNRLSWIDDNSKLMKEKKIKN